MKKQKFESKKDLFASFELTNNEMLNVKGGKKGTDPIHIPSPPPPKI